MSERPNVALGALLGAAMLFFTLLLTGLASLGGGGIAALTVTMLGALTDCVSFLAELRRVPLASVVLVGLSFVSAGALVRATLAHWRQHRLLSRLPLIPVTGELGAIAEGAGTRLYRTPAERPAAFCFGLFHPRLVVTDGLLGRLEADELRAAIHHETHHARDRAPLKCQVAQVAVTSFFWMPALGDLFERYLLVKELAADRDAEAHTSRRALAGALYEVWDNATITGAVGLADFAAPRIDRLFDPAAPLPPIWRPRRLLFSAAAAIALALVVAFPAHLDINQSARLQPMLTNMSLHGLPGMIAGLLLNIGVVAATMFAVRHFHGRGKRSRLSS